MSSPSSSPRLDRLLRVVRRTLLTLFGIQMALAIGMSLVDSYRRRGKKPKPFPVTPPHEVPVGGGTLTPYTYGQDLYDAMLAAIDGAQKQILFETYIWKGDEVGERFKAALAAAADRGVEVYCIYDGFANLVVSPRFKRFPRDDEGAALPDLPGRLEVLRPRPATAATTARSWSSTTPSGSSAATTSVRRTPPSGATPTCGSPAPGSGTSSARSPTSGTSTGGAGSVRRSARCCSRPRRPGRPGSASTATCRGCGCSRSARCTSRRSTGPRNGSG